MCVNIPMDILPQTFNVSGKLLIYHTYTVLSHCSFHLRKCTLRLLWQASLRDKTEQHLNNLQERDMIENLIAAQ